MAENRPRVVITGLGAVTPLGNDVNETWKNAIAGHSGVATITRFEPDGFETRFAATVDDFDPDDRLGRKASRRMDRYSQFAVAASLEAWSQSRLELDDHNRTRVAVLVGTALGGIETIEAGTAVLAKSGPRRLSPFLVPMMLPNMAAGNIAIALGARGSNFAPTSACASAAHAIGEAMHLIRRGDADIVVAGHTTFRRRLQRHGRPVNPKR
jgi:3-oxoacyl-[acyl-carrier-protein] synthase II